MKTAIIGAATAVSVLIQSTSALPRAGNAKLHARQAIDFELVDATPDPVVKPDDTSSFNAAAAIASVIADVKANPLPQDTNAKRDVVARDIVVSTYNGYSPNALLGNVAINAPLDCNKKVSGFSQSVQARLMC